jgi:hypothetical protein
MRQRIAAARRGFILSAAMRIWTTVLRNVTTTRLDVFS